MIAALFGLLFSSSALGARPMGLAVGAQLGEPVAVTLGYRWTDDMTVQLAQAGAGQNGCTLDWTTSTPCGNTL